MVEDRVTDGKRIAQLLASELAGRSDGHLGDVSIVDADPDAEPTPDGRLAYRVAVRDERALEVLVVPDAAVLRVIDGGGDVLDAGRLLDRAQDEGLPIPDEGTEAVRVESGAAVKRALDAVRAGVAGEFA